MGASLSIATHRWKMSDADGQLVDWETGKRFASGTHVKTWRPLAGAKYAAAKAERKAKL